MRRTAAVALVLGVALCLLRLPFVPMLNGMADHKRMPVLAIAAEHMAGQLSMAATATELPGCCALEALPAESRPLILSVAVALITWLLAPITAQRSSRGLRPPGAPPPLTASRRRAQLQAYLI